MKQYFLNLSSKIKSNRFLTVLLILFCLAIVVFLYYGAAQNNSYETNLLSSSTLDTSSSSFSSGSDSLSTSTSDTSNTTTSTPTSLSGGDSSSTTLNSTTTMTSPSTTTSTSGSGSSSSSTTTSTTSTSTSTSSSGGGGDSSSTTSTTTSTSTPSTTTSDGISHFYAVPSAPNKTSITAEVLNVQQIDSSSNFASNYTSILKIKVTSRQSIEGSFNVPDEVDAYVHKWTNDLTITDKLGKGQIIAATISYSGDEWGGIWDIREIKISASTNTKPVLNAIKPNFGPTETQITITGTGFTPTGNIVAAYGNLAMAFGLASPDGTSLTFKIPAQTVFSCEGACPWRFDRFTPGSYPITVINTNGTSNWLELKITTGYDTPVAIISLTPTSGSVGTQVRIDGYKFTTFGGNDISSQGKMIATNVGSPEGTILYFTIPSQFAPGSYPIIVTNANGTSNSKIFTVTASGITTNTSINTSQPANVQPTPASTPTPTPPGTSGTSSGTTSTNSATPPKTTTQTTVSSPILLSPQNTSTTEISSTGESPTLQNLWTVIEEVNKDINETKEQLTATINQNIAEEILDANKSQKTIDTTELARLQDEIISKIETELIGPSLTSTDIDKLNTELSAKLDKITATIFEKGEDTSQAKEVKEALDNLVIKIKDQSQDFNQQDGDLLYKDTNQDGVSDYDSIYVYNLDPIKPSPVSSHEGKKINAAEKIQLGFDPAQSELVKITPEQPASSPAPVSALYKVKEVKFTEGKKVVIKGTALPNSFITIYIYSTPIIVTVKADNNGEWQYTLDEEIENGQHKIYTATVNNTGKIMAKSADSIFTKTAEAATLEDIPLIGGSTNVEEPGLFSGNDIYLSIGFAFAALLVFLILIGLIGRKKEQPKI